MRMAIHRIRARDRRRILLTIGTLALVTVALIFGGLFIGDYQLTFPQMLATLTGNAPETRADFTIMSRRLPRALVAALVGCALAIAGAVFQRMTSNPLASPDIIGVSGGAAAGGAFVMLIMGGTIAQVAGGAVVGGLLASGLIALIAFRRTGFSTRLVLVGVGVAALSGSIVSYLLTQVFVARAVTAQTWLVGTLQGRGWNDAAPVIAALAVAIPVLLATARSANMIDLGDDSASALGVHVTRIRLLQLGAATLLTAGAVAVVGPISFIALSAPHIARALIGRPSLAASALVGSIILLISDLVALHVFMVPIPVGAVTVVFGGLFLLWLIVKQRSTHV